MKTTISHCEQKTMFEWSLIVYRLTSEYMVIDCPLSRTQGKGQTGRITITINVLPNSLKKIE